MQYLGERRSSHKVPKPNNIYSACQQVHSYINYLHKTHLQLARPDIISNFAHQLQLVNHTLAINSIALTVTSKPALRANTTLLQRLLNRNPITLSNELSSLIHPLLHRLLVLELRELRGHDAQNDVLVTGQFLEGLEAASTLGIVLKVVGVDVELLEELGGDAVIAALGEVARADKVAAADVNADVEVSGALGERVVVQLDVLVEELVGGLVVQGVFFPALEHLVGAEVCHH